MALGKQCARVFGDIMREQGLASHLCMKCSLGISNFLDEISSLSHSVVFLYIFALIADEGFLISSCYSLELCIQMDVPFLYSFAFCIFSFLSYL